MTNPKELAEAYTEAVKVHDDSFVSRTSLDGYECERCAIPIWDAIHTVFKKRGIPAAYERIVSLASHWPNDMNDWARAVIAGTIGYETEDQQEGGSNE